MTTALTSCKQGKNFTENGDALASHIDSTTKAGQDFFQYANGNWFKQNPIPPSEQSNGIFQLIQDTINAQVRKICESSSAIQHVQTGSNKQKIGDFFFSGMDSAQLNKKGISDLKYDFKAIDQVKDLKGKIFRANFYKCGDKLTVSHYVTWNLMGTKKPDYHQPEHFGLLKFV